LRKSDIFFLVILGNGLLLVLLLFQAHFRIQADLPGLKQVGGIVRNLAITDLCLSTEAGYTRHLSQSDRHSPFQTHPLALEHFPSGAILGPPDVVKRANGQVD
jgi:hypothetical protein